MRLFAVIIIYFCCISAVLAAGELLLDRCIELALQRNEAVTAAE
jgi:hypothetical protein